MKQALDTTGADVTTTLKAFLAANNVFSMVELYDFVLPFGPIFGSSFLSYTDADCDITFGGFTYTSLKTRIKRGQIKLVIGVEVDEIDITMMPMVPAVHPTSGPDLVLDTLPSSPMTVPAAAAAGLFDNAFVQVRRLFLPAPPRWDQVPDMSLGAVVMFKGFVADTEVTRSVITMKVKSPIDHLHAPIPRNVYQPGCANTLYDTVCALSKTGTGPDGFAFQYGSTVNGGASTTMQLVLNTTPPHPKGYFDLGYVSTATSDWSFGIARTIKSHVGNVIALIQPMPFTLPDGISVTLQVGCDKSLKTCQDKFNNRGRFRGFPFIPTPDTAL